MGLANDTLEVFGTEYTGVAGFKATDNNGQTKTYIRPQGTLSISANGTGIDCSAYAEVDVAVPTPSPTIQSLPVTPTESQQTFNASGVDGYKPVTVGAISSTYVGSGVTRKAAATITPGTTDQTIASGTYLTGAQTIEGDANLKAENIAEGVSIFGIQGTHSGGTSKNAQAVTSTTRVTSTSLTACSGTITVAKTGTYDVYWSTMRSSTSGSWSSRLYIDNTASGTEQTSGWSNHVQPIHLTNVSLTAGDTIRVYAKSRGSNYYAYVPLLTIIET